MWEVKEIYSESEWSDFVNNARAHTFLQSWEWGEFNRAMGSSIWRLGVLEGGKLAGVALVLKVTARRGSFLFVPHGPLVDWNAEECLRKLLSHIRRIAKEEGVAFVRVAPSQKKDEAGAAFLRNMGFRLSPIHTHAELLWLLDLSPSESELLKNMRKQTRYSVQKAGKDGVSVEVSLNPEDVEKFYAIYRATAVEQKFRPFSREYIEKEFAAFSKSDSARLFFAKYQGEPVSAALIVFSPHEAFYHQGASSKKFPQLTPSHLLQWEIIREAKRRGSRTYNFWGVSRQEEINHPWVGLSSFKRGFGGYEEEFIPSHDLPLSYKYWLTFAVEKVRRFHRGV